MKPSGKKLIRILIRIAVAAATLLMLAWLILRFTPYPDLQAFLGRPLSVRYYDRNSILLQITPLADGLRRERPEFIPEEIKDVFVFAEDQRFYSHFGVDLLALIRAFFQNITGGRSVSGASTITMQLARLISIEAQAPGQNASGEGLGRKIVEAINALRLETRLSKDEILELYLNSVPFGFNTEGVASAARTFFSSDISMLSPAQIFCLAIIPRRPSLYNPLENAEACIAAAAELQARFGSNKKLMTARPLFANINEEDWKYAASSARRFAYPFELPHLIRYINVEVNSGVNARNEVHLSIDLGLQHYLEGTIAGNVSRYYSSRLTNGAAIVIDNQNGEILAWVGSADFYNSEAAGQIDGVLALNQPGSSMKPFLYAMAMENGFKPTDVIADIPMSFGEYEVYLPRNFNNRFNGPMLFRASLASSLNIPAVYLLYRLGVQNYSQRLFTLGFDSLEYSVDDAGLGLALGNAPVSLEELVRAFSVFPRDGIYIPLTWELNGSAQANDRIYSSDTARIICSFLSDSSARVLAFGSGANFRTSFPAIFKTGTANQYQSIVALGATPGYTAGVWMGNFTGETVIGRTGSSIPAAIVRDTLVFLHGNFASSNSLSASSGQNSSGFSEPENWQLRRVCSLSGMAPTDACFSVINEYVHSDDINEPCTWHQIVNGRSEIVYPAEYQAWFNSAARQGSLDYGSRPLEILSPRDGFVYLSSPGIGRDEIPVEVIGGGEDELRVTYDGSVFTVSRPFVFYLEQRPGLHILRVQCGDEEEAISFTVEP
ncbi:MAG: transglycosylase domain-containing protein [Treponema sp.]|nr:transglycosylase domain-containing protein [Treponema sp.]